jgi:WD40 repeat protein/serine/threonine protein kinase
MSLELSGQQFKSYQFYELIGEGGFARVYRAYQPIVEREVAIKAILPVLANHPLFIRYFETEAHLVARLEHPYIVPLYDYWREPEGAFLVMRWIKNGNFRQVLQHGALDPASVLRYTGQIASALARAHYAGIIHRDLKPENILLDEQNNAYLTDFGLAWRANSESESDEDEFSSFGSPAYAAPEQFLGLPLTANADQYSFALIIYEFLTGTHPIPNLEKLSLTELLDQKTVHAPTTLPYWSSTLPLELKAVLERAMASDPKARFPNIIEFAQQIYQTLSPHIVRVSPLSSNEVGLALEQAVSALTEDYVLPNPYKGLRAFEQADAEDFYGRERLIEQLLARLADVKDPYYRFLAIVGGSGSGKSSLVKAGLIPLLRAGKLPDSNIWKIIEVTPGNQPLLAMAAALRRIAIDDPGDLRAILEGGSGGLLAAVAKAMGDLPGEVVIVFDQFEEVFTLVQDEALRQHLFALIAQSVSEPTSRVRIIITMRADFYDRPLNYAQFGRLIHQRTEVVTPMTVEELEHSITGPAKRVRVSVEPGLVAALISATQKQPGTLPLLQFALTELFVHRKNNALQLSTYQEQGGILGALARRAETVYQELDAAGQTLARQLFLRLITFEVGRGATRRRLLLTELPEQRSRQLLTVADVFVRSRLLLYDRDANSRIPTLELAHETLIEGWERYQGWIDDNRNRLHTQQLLAAAARDWVGAGYEASYLAAGARLIQFEALLASSEIILNAAEHKYLTESLRKRTQRSRQVALFIAVLAALALLASGFALFALNERNRAEQETAVSRSRELALTSLLNIGQPDRSLLLSLAAFQFADTFEARNSLLLGLQAFPDLITYWRGHQAQVRTIAYNPLQNQYATGSGDGQVIVWSPEGDAVRSWTAHTGAVNTITYSVDGQWLVSGGEDGLINCWDAETGSLLYTLTGAQEVIWSAAIHPDNSMIAAGDANGQILVWNTSRRDPPVYRLQGHTDSVYSLAFNPQGSLLASGSADQSIRLWSLADGAQQQLLNGHSNWIWDLDFHPELDQLVSASADDTVRWWDLDTGESRVIGTHADWVRTVAFKMDGSTVFTAGTEGLIREWEIESNSLIREISTGVNNIWGIVLSENGDQIASVGSDDTVRIWSLTQDTALGQRLGQQPSAVTQLAAAPEGGHVASAGADGVVRLWSTAGSADQTPTLLTGHQASVASLAYHPQYPLIVSGSVDGTLLRWDTLSNAVVGAPLTDHRQGIFSLAFDSSGARLATGGNDGSIYLWQVASPQANWQSILLSSTGHTGRVTSVAFHPTRHILISASLDNALIVWDLDTSEPIHRLDTGHTGGILTTAFSPDGRMFASGGRDGVIILWDAQTGQPVGSPLIGHNNWILSLAFSPDGRLLASGSGDGSILLWDLANQRLLGGRFTGHSNWVNTVAFDPTSTYLFSSGRDGTVLRWEVALPIWQQRACQIARRSLSPEEWRLYVPALPYQPLCGASS